MTLHDDFELCVCDHPRIFHKGPSFAPVYPHKAYWTCKGNGPRIKCRCKGFHRAIDQPCGPSDRDHVEDSGRSEKTGRERLDV